jgi:hypothetical protein
MVDQYEVDSDADPKDNDRDNDSVFLLAEHRSIVVAVVATRLEWIVKTWLEPLDPRGASLPIEAHPVEV